MRICDVPILTCLAFLEASAAHSGANLAGISSFAGRSISTGKKAIAVLEELNLVRRNTDGGYTCLAAGVRRGMDDEVARSLFRQAILRYRPFEVFIEGINFGESIQEASRKARVLLGLDPSDDESFEILVKWAAELGILSINGSVVELLPEISVKPGEELAIISTGDLLSEAKTRLYISTKLGRDVFNFLDKSTGIFWRRQHSSTARIPE